MDVYEVLLKIGYSDLKDFGQEWRTRPLYRSSDNNTSLSIKKNTGEWYDFSGRTGGGLVQLIQKTLSLPSTEQAYEIIGDLELQVADHRYELPHTRRFDKQLLLKLHKDHTYWKSRGISERTVEIFQGGVARNGRMAQRYVFPIFDENENVIGFSGRLLQDNNNLPKWKHLGSKLKWCYPSKWNAEFIIRKREVILLESIGDMLSLWEAGIKNTMVTFGLDISSKLIQTLIRFDVERIFIGFNNDKNNEFAGNTAAIDGKVLLENFFDPEQIVIALPEAKDFGVMDYHQIQLWKTQNNLKN